MINPEFLEENGDNVVEYIDKYIETHKGLLKNINPINSWGIRRIKHPNLIVRMKELYKEYRSFNIDEVASKIAKNSSWNPEDIEFLSSLNTDNFYQWMMSSPEGLHTKIRGGLLTFRNLSSSNEKDNKIYQEITQNVIGALKKIGATNKLNARRVKELYEVDISTKCNFSISPGKHCFLFYFKMLDSIKNSSL